MAILEKTSGKLAASRKFWKKFVSDMQADPSYARIPPCPPLTGGKGILFSCAGRLGGGWRGWRGWQKSMVVVPDRGRAGKY